MTRSIDFVQLQQVFTDLYRDPQFVGEALFAGIPSSAGSRRESVLS